MQYDAAILSVLDEMLVSSETIIIGQGVTDHKRIWNTIPDRPDLVGTRIIESPLSEDSVAGFVNGLSLAGLLPILVHIRSDFSLLTFNQLINVASKFRYMFDDDFRMKSIHRMVVGRSWGQGAQHSQSFHTVLAHIPGIQVFNPATSADVINAYRFARDEASGPVVINEHRLLYNLEFNDVPSAGIDNYNVRNGDDLTIVATSAMVVEAMRVSDSLRNFGITCDVLNYHNLTSGSNLALLNSAKRTRQVLVLDNTWVSYGLTGEISRILSINGVSVKLKGMGYLPSPCPTAQSLEKVYYPTVVSIIDELREWFCDRVDWNALLMSLKGDMNAVKYYKRFKGPF